MKEELVWNVYCHDFNKTEVEVRNVFNLSYRFNQGLYKLRKEYLKSHLGDFQWFSDKLRSECRYCYWAKCEYEIGLTNWPCYVRKESIDKLTEEELNVPSGRVSLYPEVYDKIDVCQQLELNWDAFAKYVFDNVKKIKKVD